MENVYTKNSDLHNDWANEADINKKMEIEAARREKERRMKADNTWNPLWKDSDELFGAVTPPKQAADSGYNAYAEAQREAQQRLAGLKQGQIQNVGALAQQAQQNAYVQKMQAQQNAPAYMAMTGQSGGLSETAAIAPSAAYGNALSGIDTQKADLINQINMSNDEQGINMAMGFADKMINQGNLEKQFDRNIYESDRNFANGVSQQSIDNAFKQMQFNYGISQDEFNQKLTMAQLAAGNGDFSKYKELGIDASGAQKDYENRNNPYYGQAPKNTVSTPEKNGDAPYKPRLTLTQVLRDIENGNLAPEVLNAYEYYYKAPYTAEMSERANAFVASIENKRSTGNGKNADIKEIEYSIRSAYQQGVLTDMEAKAIGKKYGIDYTN